MPNFSKIVAFPVSALRLAPASSQYGGAYPRFAKAFGNRSAAPTKLLPPRLV